MKTMNGINKAILAGSIKEDPVLMEFESGSKKVSFQLITEKKWKTKQGEKKSFSQWHNIEMWGDKASAVSEWMSEGDLIFVEGKISSESYDKDWVKKYITKIKDLNIDAIFCKKIEEAKKRKSTSSNEQVEYIEPVHVAPKAEQKSSFLDDDDLPF